jgi:hypothetical protein
MVDYSPHPECVFGSSACRWAYDLGYTYHDQNSQATGMSAVYVFIADKYIYKFPTPIGLSMKQYTNPFGYASRVVEQIGSMRGQMVSFDKSDPAMVSIVLGRANAKTGEILPQSRTKNKLDLIFSVFEARWKKTKCVLTHIAMEIDDLHD